MIQSGGTGNSDRTGWIGAASGELEQKEIKSIELKLEVIKLRQATIKGIFYPQLLLR